VTPRTWSRGWSDDLDPERGTTGRRGADIEETLERLLSATSPDDRDRVLLEAACAGPGGPGAELWRLVGGTWRPTRERPGVVPPPPRDRVQAYLAGRLDDDLLPAGETVVRAPGARLALALGGDHPEDRRDLLEALLVVRATLDPDGNAPDGNAPFGGALPSGPPPSP